MGKPEDELSFPPGGPDGRTDAENPSRSNGEVGCGCGAGGGCCLISRFFGLRCVLVLLLGLAVFLSAAFWIPPLSRLSDPEDPDPKYKGHKIVASFKLKNSISFVQENIEQLESDIFEEIQVPNAKVVILTLHESAGSNITDVVFGVDPERKHSQISPASQSLLRSTFGSLVTRQSHLRLSSSFFGNPYYFEVLKFSGGITIAPAQRAFLLQNTEIRFNFTLNFSIYQVRENFNALRSQLKSGLHLAFYENLYITLTNQRGSTIDPPVTVQTRVLLAVGIPPSVPRVKQLAHTITAPQSSNLGLNHSVFGKVKQVSLSSIPNHPLTGGTSSSSAPTPAPASSVHSHHHHHHHHHKHDHKDHDHDVDLSPSIAPSPVPTKKTPLVPIKSSAHAPAPAPMKSYHRAPTGCQYGFRKRHGKQYTSVPAAAPRISPLYATKRHPPAGSPAPVSYRVPPSSPLPHVVLVHQHPPSGSKTDADPPDETTLKAPSPSPSGAGFTPTIPWIFSLLVAMLHLQVA